MFINENEDSVLRAKERMYELVFANIT